MDKELNNVENDNTLPCQEQLNAVHTTLNLLNGKWRIYILVPCDLEKNGSWNCKEKLKTWDQKCFPRI